MHSIYEVHKNLRKFTILNLLSLTFLCSVHIMELKIAPVVRSNLFYQNVHDPKLIYMSFDLVTIRLWRDPQLAKIDPFAWMHMYQWASVIKTNISFRK